MDLSLGVAFLGGVASFLSPCVLSMVPIYIGYLGGRSFVLQEREISPAYRFTVFFNGVLFILGFSLVFIVMGTAMSVIGGYLIHFRWWISKLVGIVICIMGFHVAGIISIKWLEYDLKFKSYRIEDRSFATSFLLGVTFAAGWTPCFGPILASILALTLQDGSIINGVIYLSVYSIGLAIPFLLISLSIEGLSAFLQKSKKVSFYLNKTMGILLIIMGLMLATGIYDFLVQSLSIYRLG